MSDQLRSIFSRWQRLEEEKADLSEALRDLFAEAKSNGLDTKALRIAFRLKAAAEGPKAQEVAETASLVEVYVAVLGGEEVAIPSRERTRVARERMPKSAYQEPRLATLGEKKEAFASGNPISGDARHWENGRVYVARCFALRLIKVGVSNDVDARVAQLSKEMGESVTLVSHFEGGRQDELRLQEALATWNHSGEWFSDTPDCKRALDAWIQQNIHEATHAHPRVARESDTSLERGSNAPACAPTPVAGAKTAPAPIPDDDLEIPAALRRYA